MTRHPEGLSSSTSPSTRSSNTARLAWRGPWFAGLQVCRVGHVSQDSPVQRGQRGTTGQPACGAVIPKRRIATGCRRGRSESERSSYSLASLWVLPSCPSTGPKRTPHSGRKGSGAFAQGPGRVWRGRERSYLLFVQVLGSGCTQCAIDCEPWRAPGGSREIF
ncbi:hypothetical protein GQ53DRAFT_744193 [Thozetella sp. PMI_491]|nr:hypothetical protein GQ53DRAFT_744193 [Thozetella sp. PMI_491]